MSTVNQHLRGDGNVLSGSGDVRSSSFASNGGTQNIAQGDGAIGCQINNYGSLSAAFIIPRQIPALEPCFLHREEELVWLNERLHPGKVVTVCGPGGMGKSALAAQAVHRLEADRFPDGIIFHSFYHQPKVETALQAICAAYQIEAKAGFETAVRNALSGRKALLILDGSEEADDLPALLRLRGMCGVLITSRKTEDAPDEPLELKRLEKAQAEEVFLRYSGPVNDTASVQGICKILDGWPVALRIAGRYLRRTKERAADYLQWLEQEPFKELVGGKHQEGNAALLLRRSVDAVSAAAQFALNIIGALAFAPFTERSVVALLKNFNNYRTPWDLCRRLKTMLAHRRTWLFAHADDDLRFCRDVLNELLAYGLLEKQDKGWKVSHALIHAYLRSKMPLNRWSLKGLARSYIAFCREQSAAGVQGYACLDGERAHCLRLMESCMNSKLWQEVKDLAWAINTYLDWQGHWTEWRAATEMWLAAAQQSGDRRNEGVCLNTLGSIYGRRDELEKALDCYQKSLSIWHELGDRKEESTLLNNIATIYRKQNRFELALQHYEQGLSIAREIGDRKGEGVKLNNIGQFYDYQGDYEQALQYYEQCLPVNQEVGDRRVEGVTLNNIALIYSKQNDPAKALDYHERSLIIFQDLGYMAGEAASHWNIGLTYRELGDFAKEEEHISQAVRLAEQIGDSALEQYRDGLARVWACASCRERPCITRRQKSSKIENSRGASHELAGSLR